MVPAVHARRSEGTVNRVRNSEGKVEKASSAVGELTGTVGRLLTMAGGAPGGRALVQDIGRAVFNPPAGLMNRFS